jgi:site-specific recombinase XerD
LGNWFTADQARALWQVPDPNTLKGKRDRALLGFLLGCVLRRKEAAELDIAQLRRAATKRSGSACRSGYRSRVCEISGAWKRLIPLEDLELLVENYQHVNAALSTAASC